MLQHISLAAQEGPSVHRARTRLVRMEVRREDDLEWTKERFLMLEKMDEDLARHRAKGCMDGGVVGQE